MGGDRTAGRLAGAAAIVTGAGRGLGAEVASLFAREGALVALVGRDPEPLGRVAEEVRREHEAAECLVVPGDVTDEPDIERAVGEVAEAFAGIDVLVNAAGSTGPVETPAHELDPDGFRAVMDVNLVGTFLACRFAIPHLLKSPRGRIVNIVGTAGLRGYPNRAGYAASKWGVRGLTRTLALELGRHGVTVNAVCPGATRSERIDKVLAERSARAGVGRDEMLERQLAQTLLGRLLEPSEVAELILFLASDAGAGMTGQDVVMDAGWSV